ncbi:MAG TPA: pyridoxamine 5'-phosphate oxidase family protein [Thermoanaerobaculia bacterium]|nr:pyridoxamine 5'-phosphate oxidase family protein [Thermoanaerobaculia bacterium]
MNDIVLEQTEKTRIHRLPERGNYDRATIHAILDEALICHVGFVVEGRPVVIPTIHACVADHLYFHGSPAAGMLRTLRNGVDACVTVTLLDGLVLARSAFHHSMNYRSVVVFGKAEEVTDREEKLRVLKALVEHVCRGRSADARGPNASELKQTLVLRVPISEASAKMRTGPPKDDAEDYTLPIWAGVLPLALAPGTPVPDNQVITPRYVSDYER